MLGRIMTEALSLLGDLVWLKEMQMGARFTRGRLVIVSFLCWYDGRRDGRRAGKTFLWVWL